MLLVIEDASEKDRTEPLSKMLGASSDRFEDWYVDVEMIEAWSSGMPACDNGQSFLLPQIRHASTVDPGQMPSSRHGSNTKKLRENDIPNLVLPLIF